MLILLFILGVTLAVSGFMLKLNFNKEHRKEHRYDVYKNYQSLSSISNHLFYIGCVFSIIILITMYMVGGSLVKGKVIDETIELYTRQNQKIEAEISGIVQNRQDFEYNIFTELKSTSPITLTNVYPELASNSIVMQQTALYISNNDKITALEKSKIELKICKWWLYFGG